MMKARSPYSFLYPVLLGLMVVMMAGLLPFHAFANNVSDVKGEAEQIHSEIWTLTRLIAFVSYVVGTAFAVRALFALKNYIQAPDDNPVNRVIGFATVSTLLIMLPYSIGVTANANGMYGQTSIKSSAPAFQQQNLESCPTGAKLSAVFCNIVNEVKPFASFLAVISYVMAINLTLTGLLNLKAYGDDPSQTPLRSIIMKFVLATLLISLPLSMQVFVSAVTGTQSINSQSVTIKKPALYSGSLQ